MHNHINRERASQSQPLLVDEPGEDPRITAYRRWLAAVDRQDIHATSQAAREMRAMGVWAVTTVSRRRPGGGA